MGSSDIAVVKNAKAVFVMSQTGESGNSGENLVREWKEIKTSQKLKGIERKDISAIVGIIKDEINLKDGADKFGETLEKMMHESTSKGTTTKLIGDLNDDTMVFAIFHCIKDADNDDLINMAYVINTLSTDLPRENTRLNIRTVRDFSHPDLTQKMIDHLTKDSEAEIAKMTEGQTTSVPIQPEPVAPDVRRASSFCTSILGPALATAAAAASEGFSQGPEGSENLEDFGDLRKDFAGLRRDFADLKKDFLDLKKDFTDLKKDCAAGLVPVPLAVADETSSEHLMMWTSST